MVKTTQLVLRRTKVAQNGECLGTAGIMTPEFPALGSFFFFAFSASDDFVAFPLVAFSAYMGPVVYSCPVSV